MTLGITPAILLVGHIVPSKPLNAAASLGSLFVLFSFTVALYCRAGQRGKRRESWGDRFLAELQSWNGILDEETEDALRHGNPPRF